MLTVQDVLTFIKDYGLGALELATVVAVELLRPHVPKIKETFRWVCRTRYVSIPSVVIIIALVGCLNPHSSEKVIRYIGLLLQLAGTTTVIWGVIKTRKDFNLEPLWSKVVGWVKDCPLRHKIGTLGAVSAQGRSSIMSASAYQAYPLGDNPSIESVVEAMMKYVGDLHQSIANTRHELEVKIQVVQEGEEQARKEEAQSIRQELLQTATGGLHISAIGATWLLLGILLGTISQEIAALVSAVYH